MTPTTQKLAELLGWRQHPQSKRWHSPECVADVKNCTGQLPDFDEAWFVEECRKRGWYWELETLPNHDHVECLLWDADDAGLVVYDWISQAATPDEARQLAMIKALEAAR